MRSACRSWTHSAELYSAVTGEASAVDFGSGIGTGSGTGSGSIPPNQTDDAAALGCGWFGLPIRHNLTDPGLYLSFSLGTCMEYSTASTELLPVNGPAAGGEPLFVSTPAAAYCLPGVGVTASLSSAAYWLQFVTLVRTRTKLSTRLVLTSSRLVSCVSCACVPQLNCVLFFIFLMRMRRKQRQAAKKFDRAVWTAADYTLLVDGLDKCVHADDVPGHGGRGLEGRVYADLEACGFPRSCVAKVEVGRECMDEVREIAKLGRIMTREQELRSKKRSAEEKGKATNPKVDAELERISEAKADVERRLNQFREEPDMSTGHAFITFLYELDTATLSLPPAIGQAPLTALGGMSQVREGPKRTAAQVSPDGHAAVVADPPPVHLPRHPP